MWKNVINETAVKAANFMWSVYLLMIDTLLLRPKHIYENISLILT